jgi:formylglycine-generating enzyme required for sulfatase activity
MARLALLIGVSKYGAGIPALPECVVDVDAMQRVLVHPEMGGFAAADITVLKDPQRQEMVDAIHQLFNNRNKDDLLLFYFSGHGMMDEDEYKLHLANSGTYNNENSRVYAPSAVEAAYIHQRLNYSKSKRLVLILDCCYSGAFAKEMTKGDNTINLENYLGGKGRAILTSSSASERSLGAKVTTEHGNSGLSIYTRYLVEGIETGAADLDDDGWISVDELHEYASKKVKESAPAMTPKFYPMEDGYKIRLSKSRRDDPNLKYEREFQSRVDEGIVEIHQRVEPSVTRRSIDRRNFIKWISFSGAGVIMAFVLPQIFKGLDTPTQTPIKSSSLQNISTIEFASVKLNDKGTIIDRPKRQAQIYKENLGNGISLTMVKIPAGEFLMGSPTTEAGRYDYESPQHKVKVPEFYIGQTLVTQSQFQQIMGNNPSKFTGDGKLPVEQVSWVDTQNFCQKLSQRTHEKYRLPTEAEWEYACRGGITTPFHFGETITTDVANFDGNGIYGNTSKGKHLQKTTSVGFSNVVNNFGLYDMHGNLWEWCLDHWHQNYQGAPSDGGAWLSVDDKANRIVRGGSWNSYPRNCRSATRDISSPFNRNDDVGFRVVCEILRT